MKSAVCWRLQKILEQAIWLVSSTLTRGRNLSKSYYRILQHHWRPNPPSEGYCCCPERKKVREMTKRVMHEKLETGTFDMAWEFTQRNHFTMAVCSSTPYNSSVRAVLRKHSSASLCFSPLAKRTHSHIQHQGPTFQQTIFSICN